jgi:uncharacterized protein with NRDE domain
MCVAALAWAAHPRWRLVAMGNRDEFHERPAAPLALWPDGSGVIAGRDLRAGGTWLGVGPEARFALVTNFRVEGYPQPDRPSRGGLITGWLTGEALPDIAAMNPFNLLLADRDSARVVSNYPQVSEVTLPPGVHGLSNGAFTAPWPKTRQLCAALSGWLEDGTAELEPLFTALRREVPDPALASAEHGPEPRLAPVFIRDATYGTRCSSVILIDADGHGQIMERRFDPAGNMTGETCLTF